MKQTALLGLALTAAVATAQDVPAFSYQWTMSGKQYVTLGYALEQSRDLSFDFVAGTEVKTSNAPAFGIGASYVVNREKWFAKAGVFVLFPQKSQPDLGLGLSFGVRF